MKFNQLPIFQVDLAQFFINSREFLGFFFITIFVVRFLMHAYFLFDKLMDLHNNLDLIFISVHFKSNITCPIKCAQKLCHN